MRACVKDAKAAALASEAKSYYTVIKYETKDGQAKELSRETFAGRWRRTTRVSLFIYRRRFRVRRRQYLRVYLSNAADVDGFGCWFRWNKRRAAPAQAGRRPYRRAQVGTPHHPLRRVFVPNWGKLRSARDGVRRARPASGPPRRRGAARTRFGEDGQLTGRGMPTN